MIDQRLKFDFDRMALLAKAAPIEFAKERDALLREAIASFRDSEAGFRIQAEIDALRLHTPPGVKTCRSLLARLESTLATLTADLQRLAPTVKRLKERSSVQPDPLHPSLESTTAKMDEDACLFPEHSRLIAHLKATNSEFMNHFENLQERHRWLGEQIRSMEALKMDGTHQIVESFKQERWVLKIQMSMLLRKAAQSSS